MKRQRIEPRVGASPWPGHDPSRDYVCDRLEDPDEKMGETVVQDWPIH